jgi:hypothetical protein
VFLPHSKHFTIGTKNCLSDWALKIELSDDETACQIKESGVSGEIESNEKRVVG